MDWLDLFIILFLIAALIRGTEVGFMRQFFSTAGFFIGLFLGACMEYGPWARNYRMAARKGYVDPNPLSYTWVWLQGLHYRMFFMISGPPKQERVLYNTREHQRDSQEAICLDIHCASLEIVGYFLHQ